MLMCVCCAGGDVSTAEPHNLFVENSFCKICITITT